MDKMRHVKKKQQQKKHNNYGNHNCPQLLVSFPDLSKTSAFFSVFLFSQHMLDCGQFEVSKDVFSSTSYFLTPGFNQHLFKWGGGEKENIKKGQNKESRL